MQRLVLLLAVGLGWALYSQTSGRRSGRLRYGSRSDAYPFPTAASHAGIDFDDDAGVRKWCDTLDCSEEQLRAAVRQVGSSVEAVSAHLSRRR